MRSVLLLSFAWQHSLGQLKAIQNAEVATSRAATSGGRQSSFVNFKTRLQLILPDFRLLFSSVEYTASVHDTNASRIPSITSPQRVPQSANGPQSSLRLPYFYACFQALTQRASVI